VSDSPRAAKLLACESVVLAQGGTVLRCAFADEKYKDTLAEIKIIVVGKTFTDY